MQNLILNINSLVLFCSLFVFNNIRAQQSNTMKVDIDSVLVKAEKTEESVFDETVDINSDNDFQHTSTTEILDKNSTIYIKQYGKGQLASVSLKGFQASQTNMLWNGVKINSPMNGQSDLNILQIGNSNRLKISSENADNISGAIDLVQDFSFEPKNELSFSAAVGSFVSSAGNFSYLFSNKRWYSSSLVSYQSAKNNFSYINPSLPGNTRTKQVNAETKLFNFDQQLVYKMNSRNEIKIFAKYFRADRNLAPSLFETNATENQKDQLALGKFAWHHHYLNLQTEFNTAFVYQDLDYRFSQNSGIDRSIAYSWQTNFTLKNKFSEDLEYKLLASQEIETAKSVNYLEDAHRHRLLLDNEVSYTNQNFTSSLGFTEMLVNGKLSPFLPKARLIFRLYDLPANLIVTADYQAKLRYPSLNEMYWTPGGNENLMPETSHNLKLNAILARKIGNVSFENKFEYYSIWANNYIQWQPTASNIWEPRNIGNVASRGVSNNLDVDVSLKKDIDLNFNFDYHFNRITNLKNSKQLIYAPYTQINLATNFESKWFNFGFNHHYTGKRYADNNNTISLSAFYLLDFNAYKVLKFKNKDELTVGAQLNNMTNQNYYTVINRPVPGFNFEFSLKYKLNFIKT